MNPELINAVLRRGDNRCAWCGCALNTGRVADRGVVCQLDLSGEDSSMVASCAACAGEFTRRWPFTTRYTIEAARRFLGRHDGYVFTGLFVDYLERVCGPMVERPDGKRSGLQTPFATALKRVEAQRNAPLYVAREKVRAA